MGLVESKNYVLAILCSDDHIITKYEKAERSDGQFFADSYNRVMAGVSINEISINLNQSGSSSPKGRKSPQQQSPMTAQFGSVHESGMTDGSNNLTQTHDNKVVEMVRDELCLDCHYLMDKLIILVIINADTINNTVLIEW